MSDIDKWRQQEQEIGRTRYPFAADDDTRCEAVREAAAFPFGKDGQTTLYRCGKRIGHDRRHECSDEGAWSVKW